MVIRARSNVAVLAARRILDAGVVVDAPHAFPAPGELDSNNPYRAARNQRRLWGVPNGRIDSARALDQAGDVGSSSRWSESRCSRRAGGHVCPLAQLMRLNRRDLHYLFPWDFCPALKVLGGVTRAPSGELAPPTLRTV